MASRILVVLLVKVVDMYCQMKRRFPGRGNGFQIVYVARIILSQGQLFPVLPAPFPKGSRQPA